MRNFATFSTSVNFKNIKFLGLLLFLINITWANNIGHDYAFNERQEIIVRGQIQDSESGFPLPGVNIIVKGTNNGAVTDFDGNYEISVTSKSAILTFSYIGYINQEVTVGDKRIIDLSMIPDLESLDEVVVVGFGTQKKQSVTGSIVSIKSEDLIRTPVSNISNAISGRLPGVSTLQGSGVPGEDAATIRIRGIGTLNDGAEAAPLILLDGVVVNSIDQLDPNEIESFNVLKDASATAVYGVRGANGVILITTKIGKIGKPKISFKSNFGVNAPAVIPDFLASYDYAILRNEALANDGRGPVFTEEDIQKFKDGSDPIFYPTDSQYNDFVDNLSFRNQYNVNVSGGTEGLRYFVSGAILTQNATYNLPELDQNIGFDPKPKYTRYNLRSNFDLKLTDLLTAKIRAGGYFDKQRNVNLSNNNTNNPNEALLTNIIRASPMSGVGFYEGKLITGYRNDPLGNRDIIDRGASVYNAIYDGGFRERVSNQITLNVEFLYNLKNITPGLRARSKVAFNHYYYNQINRGKDIDSYSFVYDPNGNHQLLQTGFASDFGSSESQYYRRDTYAEVGLEYSKQIKDHKVTGLILYNQSKEHDPNFSFNVPKGILGLAGRTTYNYKDKYLAEFNIGYNGSENFKKGKRFGLFPAYSLGWVVSEESFLKKSKFLSYFKLRGSYGEVGNDKLGGSRFLYLPPVYQFPANNWLDNGYYFGTEGQNLQFYPGAAEDAVGNPDVTWEVKKSTNLAVELTFFNKLDVDIDVFEENRSNILWKNTVVPGIIASELVPGNIGKVSNKGFEVATKWRDNIGGDFSYNIGANYSFVRNKVIYQAEPPRKYAWLDETGFSVNQYKYYRNEGFYNETRELYNRPYYNVGGNQVQRGDLTSVDINGDGLIGNDDIVPTGFNNFPEIFYGINAGFNWKGLDFSILFQGASNFSAALRGNAAWAFNNGMTSTLTNQLERWNEERYNQGLPITQPRVAENGGDGVNNFNNSFYLKDRSYVRLKNIELGYNIESPFLKRNGINDIRVYVNGFNLKTWSKVDIDPESTNVEAYPVLSTYNFGVNLNIF